MFHPVLKSSALTVNKPVKCCYLDAINWGNIQRHANNFMITLNDEKVKLLG